MSAQCVGLEGGHVAIHLEAVRKVCPEQVTLALRVYGVRQEMKMERSRLTWRAPSHLLGFLSTWCYSPMEERNTVLRSLF